MPKSQHLISSHLAATLSNAASVTADKEAGIIGVIKVNATGMGNSRCTHEQFLKAITSNLGTMKIVKSQLKLEIHSLDAS